MILPKALPTLLAAVAAALASTSAWLTFDNPDIHHTSRGETYSCLAPWDTVLNDADNIPGGEPAPDGDEIGARCRDAGHDRFELAVAAGSAGLLLGIVATAVSRRRRGADVHPPPR